MNAISYKVMCGTFIIVDRSDDFKYQSSPSQAALVKRSLKRGFIVVNLVRANVVMPDR